MTNWKDPHAEELNYYLNLIYIITGVDQFSPWARERKVTHKVFGRDSWFSQGYVRLNDRAIKKLAEAFGKYESVWAEDPKVRERALEFVSSAPEGEVRPGDRNLP